VGIRAPNHSRFVSKLAVLVTSAGVVCALAGYGAGPLVGGLLGVAGVAACAGRMRK
jgi:hypothetical protein